jgi:hypothetical protein
MSIRPYGTRDLIHIAKLLRRHFEAGLYAVKDFKCAQCNKTIDILWYKQNSIVRFSCDCRHSTVRV